LSAFAERRFYEAEFPYCMFDEICQPKSDLESDGGAANEEFAELKKAEQNKTVKHGA